MRTPVKTPHIKPSIIVCGEMSIYNINLNISHCEMTDLVLTVMLHSWQSRLLAVSVHPAVVGPVGLLDPPVVRDVLSLGVDSVEALVDRFSCVVAVLPDNAVRSVQELV